MSEKAQATIESNRPACANEHDGTSRRTRYVLITGCGVGGIGAALAVEFLSRGFDAICTFLPGESREHLATLPRCHVLDADVTSDQSISDLKGSVEQLTGGYLDVLCNNAGMVYQVPAVDYDMAAVERMLAVNIAGPMRMVSHFHRLVIKAKGIIFNTSSTAAFFPSVYQAAYCASKAALNQYCNTLRIELAPLGVKVITIISGEVDTNILKRDLGRTIAPDSVYAPMSQRYEQSINRQEPRMPPAEYARGVVNHVLARNPSPRYWRGTWSGSVKLLHRCFPMRTYDFVAKRMFHLEELESAKKKGVIGKLVSRIAPHG